MSLELAVLIFTCVTNICLGLLVLLRNPNIKSSIFFFALSLSISLWAITNYMTEADISLSLNRLFNSLAFMFAFWGMVSMSLFCSTFQRKTKFLPLKTTVLGLGFMAFSFFCTTQFIAGNVTRDQQGLHFSVGSLSILYTIVLLGLLVFSIVKLVKLRKQATPVVKKQIKLMLFGFLVSVILGLFATVLIPLINSSYEAAKFGPLLTVFLVGSVTYAIIRHRLFDIRLVVARSLGYVLSIVALAAIYGVIAFYLIGTFIFTESTSVLSQEVVYTLLAVVLAFTFQPLKHFFDKLTNRLFYQDAYEPQSLLNDLNSSLVSTMNVEAMLKDTSLLIEHYLKTSYVYFYIFENNNRPAKYFSSQDVKITGQDIQKLSHVSGKKIINLEDTTSLPNELHDLISSSNMGILATLSSAEEGGEVIGVILLGRKKSGSSFGHQDFRIMEIIADELVIAIQNALRFEEIQRFNITLQQKVDDATGQLRQANQKLIAMDQTKDDFISMASHQLRTPLTSVKGYVSMVLEGDVGKISDQQRKLLDQSFLSAQRMVYLIADLLNVSRLKTGKFVIESKPTNLAEIVEGELAQLKETAAARKLEIKYDKPKDFPMLDMDETKIRQVIMNFADNAIYYTSSGGHIKVVVADRGDSVEFTVTDDGIGVPKAEQHNLFNKFYRAGNARKARPDGTGLGLFMAKKVVVAQGGEIIFKSEEGKGSTFGFRFDKKKLTPGTRTVKFDEEDEATGVDETAKKEHTRRSTKDAEQQGSSEPQP